MSKNRIETFCAYRLGDNLAHLHFLRKMAEAHTDMQFTHACHLCYIDQLSEVIWDLPNIRLIPLEYKSESSVDAWKNAGGWWENNILKNNYGRFYIAFFRHLAEVLGLSLPDTLQKPLDLLFDYPAIKMRGKVCEPFDILIINSKPMSNQWQGYSEPEMNEMISVLARKYSVITTAKSRLQVPCSADHGWTATTIGAASLLCDYVIGASTGPSWPTFNIWNKESVKRRIIMLDSEDVNIAPNTVCVKSMLEAKKMLQLEGLV